MSFVDAWRSFWFAPVPLTRLAVFRVLVMALAFVELRAYTPAFLAGAELAHSGVEGAFWNPIFALTALDLEPPSPELAALCVRIGAVAALCGIVGLFSNLSCAVAASSLLYTAAMVYSFEKVHHDKVALAFTLLVLPLAPIGARLSLDASIARFFRAWRRSEPAPRDTLGDTSVFAGFPMRCTQVTLAIGYGCAGLSKLIIAGPQWANGYTLMGYLAEFELPWSPWFVGGVVRMTAFSIFALGLQLAFPLILIWPRLAWLFVPAAISNHIVNWMTLDTGPYASLWILTLAFVPFEQVPGWVREGLRSRSWPRRVFALVAPLAPTLLIGWLWFAHYLPPWSAFLAVAMLAMLWRSLARASQVVLTEIQ